MLIPDQYKEICGSCGAEIDARDLGQVMAHGNFNMDSGKFECGEPKKIEYGGSRKVGEAVEWTASGKMVNLN